MTARNQRTTGRMSATYRSGGRRPMRPGEAPATVTTEWLIVTDLKVDHAYQRDITPGRVREIVENFDPDLLGTFMVSRRSNGTQFLLDGQTRQAALIDMNWGDQRVPCLVYSGLSKTDEARIFVGANVTRTKPGAVAIFKGRLAAGDEFTREVHETCMKHGYMQEIKHTNLKHGAIMSPAAVVAIATRGGMDILDRTLAVTSSAWPGQHVNAPMLKALAIFLTQYGPALQMERLVTVLARTTPDVMVSRARALSSATRSTLPLVQVLVGDYNARLKNGRLIFTELADSHVWRPRSVMYLGDTAAVSGA